MEKKPILIAAASLDEHAFKPVASIIEERGYPIIVYQTDRVLSGDDTLFLTIGNHQNISARYNSEDISPEIIGSAWFRKLRAYDQSHITERAKQLYINNEMTYMHDTLWGMYPDDTWLNSPTRIRKADRKLNQLNTAQEIGLNIPETVIGNDWEDISSKLLHKDSDRLVAKTIRGLISDGENLKAMYTTLLSGNDIEDLETYTVPYPGIYQPYIEKGREWRVTAVGEDIFPASIYTSGEGKVDWRTRQTTPDVNFRNETLPDGIDEKCIQYLGKMGLRFGAFDFIEKPDGEMVFLECNPNGQYSWLEESLGFPISQSIASELIRIASSR